MTKQIECKAIKSARQGVRVRVIKAPLVDTAILKSIISERAKAVVL